MGKIYFASDFHLGTPTAEASKAREQRILRWLDSIISDAEALYLMGDVFDFWFEYKYVVPKGYVRFLAKLAEFKDKNIPVYIFTGNHDMFLLSYLQEEIGVEVSHQLKTLDVNGKRFFIGHGDGLPKQEGSVRLLKKVFHSRWFQWIFARFHPNFSFAIADFWSKKSRASQEEPSFSKDDEWLLEYSEERLQSEYFDFFVFGHRHLTIDYTLSNGVSRYINLGEWFSTNSYAVFDGQELEIRFFENDAGRLANQ